MVLPTFRPSAARTRFSNEKYNAVENALGVELAHILQTKDQQDVLSSVRFLEAFFEDIAMTSISPHLNNETVDEQLLRKAYQLFEAIALRDSARVRTSTIVDAILSSQGRKYDELDASLQRTLTIERCQELLTGVNGIVQTCFGARVPPTQTLTSLHRILHVLAAILRTKNSSIMAAFLSPDNTKGLSYLMQIYDTILPSIRGSLPGTPEHSDWGATWLRIKICILDILHDCVTYLVDNASSRELLLDTMMNLTKATRNGNTQTAALLDSPLLVDYENLFAFSAILDSLGVRSDDMKIRHLTQIFLPYGENVHMESAILQTLFHDADVEKTPLARTRDFPPTTTKGKGRATQAQVEDESRIEEVIVHVLEILPDQDPEFLRRCLQHPTYRGEDGKDKLIASLLDGSIPIELMDAAEPSGQSTVIDASMEAVEKRRNVFDDQLIDLSSLRIGKKRDNADEMMQDKSWIQEMKAEIMRRAEATSDDEEEMDRQRGSRKTPYEYEDDDQFDELDDSVGNVSVAGDGEESDASDDEPDTNKIETILELAYINDPKVFDRDSATRKSKERADLSAKTGWSHEQLEGWRIVLERNPRKNKILQKHEFRGNKALHPVDGINEAGPSRRGGESHSQLKGETGSHHPREQAQAQGGEPRGKARGGGSRGRGRGRGSGGDENTARDRAWKERNKNRARGRGHDKKMARGAPAET